MFRKLFSGKYSVWQTYWGGFVGFNFLMNLAVRAATPLLLWLYVEYDEWIGDLLVTALAVIGAVYCAFLARGMYLSMHNDRRPGAWGWIGLAIIVIGVCTYGYQMVAFHLSGLPVSHTSLREDISALKLTLPYETEPGKVIEDVSLGQGTLRYVYRVDGYKFSDGEVNMLTEMEDDGTCEDYSGYFNGGLKRLEMVYKSDSGATVGYMDGAECLAYLSQQ